MRKQDFYSLPRSIQDRFIESSQGAAAPVPIAVAVRSESRSLIWGITSLVTLGGWVGFFMLGFGDLRSPLALSNLSQQLVHVAFGALASFCALRAYSLSWLAGRLPYLTGDFLFPSGVINARFGELSEYDAQEVKKVEVVGKTLKVTYPNATFQFPIENGDFAAQAATAFEAAKTKWDAVVKGEPLDRARLNPLIDSKVPNPLAPTQPHERPSFMKTPALVGIAVVLGIALGFGVSFWRDSLSQKALYRAAISANTVEAYQAYLKRGGDREEVKSLLLPRAELEKAIAAGTIEAITAFTDKRPDSQIGGEIQNALRIVLLRELERAKEKGTLAAIDGFAKKYESQVAIIAPEISAARREIYARAMARFQEHASNKDEALIPFVQQLLTYAQAHGPTVQLRFVQEFKQDAENLDKIVSKSKKYYMGRKSLPTQYFLGDNARRREKVLLERIQKRLQQEFPEDILHFTLAEPPSKENTEPPAIQVPTLTLMHSENLSGGYVGGVPKAMYMAATILVTATMEMPNVSEPVLSFKWSTWKNPDFSILVDSKKDIPDVYEDMVMGSYEKFLDLYLKRWLLEP